MPDTAPERWASDDELAEQWTHCRENTDTLVRWAEGYFLHDYPHDRALLRTIASLLLGELDARECEAGIPQTDELPRAQ